MGNYDEPEDCGLFPAFSDAMLAADAAASPQAAVSFPASFGTDLPVGNQDLQSSEPRRMRSAGCLPGALRLASAVSMSNLLQRVVPEAQGLSTLRRCGCGKHGGSTGSSDVFFTCSFL
jgi:hypothetical protein